MMTTVKQAWEMCCPNCGADSRIDVLAQIWVRLLPNGTDAAQASEASEEWDNNSPCICEHCGHRGTVGDFATGQP